jgi:hypothetical protein
VFDVACGGSCVISSCWHGVCGVSLALLFCVVGLGVRAVCSCYVSMVCMVRAVCSHSVWRGMEGDRRALVVLDVGWGGWCVLSWCVDGA